MAPLLTSPTICFVLVIRQKVQKKAKNEFENLLLRIAKLIFVSLSVSAKPDVISEFSKTRFNVKE
jgi:hypothetical protein